MSDSWYHTNLVWGITPRDLGWMTIGIGGLYLVYRYNQTPTIVLHNGNKETDDEILKLSVFMKVKIPNYEYQDDEGFPVSVSLVKNKKGKYKVVLLLHELYRDQKSYDMATVQPDSFKEFKFTLCLRVNPTNQQDITKISLSKFRIELDLNYDYLVILEVDFTNQDIPTEFLGKWVNDSNNFVKPSEGDEVYMQGVDDPIGKIIKNEYDDKQKVNAFRYEDLSGKMKPGKSGIPLMIKPKDSKKISELGIHNAKQGSNLGTFFKDLSCLEELEIEPKKN